MKDKYKKLIIPISILIITVISIYFITKNLTNDSSNINTTKDIDISINTDDGDEDVDWDNLLEQELTNNLTITKEGSYTLTGDVTETVTINVNGNVKLIMNNVNIKPNDGAGIIVKQADNVLIYLNDGTNNTIVDTNNYSYDDTDIDGAIYSKDDLIFDGSGTLNIMANYQDGIVSKDDLKIINGTYNITSNDDAIRGKDSVYIKKGNFNITSDGDGIKSTNDTDTEKGYVLIENGAFTITSELDGIQAETKLVIEDGTFNITTGGGSSNSSTSNNWGMWGRGQSNSTSSTTSSAKGLKAVSNLVINAGNFTFNTSDDAIHSNDYVGITNGNIDISSGDDGIHADTKLIIDEGNINITKSYEGIESSSIIINNGNIYVTASDDGINVAGGNDNSARNRPGENTYSNNNDNILTINNGKVIVNATGDGIDVNGSAYIYGGEIYVDGPTDNGNGTLDYDREFIVDGGTLIASGSSGMMQSISSSKQYNVTISFNNTYKANSNVQIFNSNNEEIISYMPSKTFSSIIISTSKLEANQTYTIKINDTKYENFTTSSLSTSIGNNYGNMMPGGDRGRGPRR